MNMADHKSVILAFPEGHLREVVPLSRVEMRW